MLLFRVFNCNEDCDKVHSLGIFETIKDAKEKTKSLIDNIKETKFKESADRYVFGYYLIKLENGLAKGENIYNHYIQEDKFMNME